MIREGRRHRRVVVGLGLLSVVVIASLVGLVATPYDPSAVNPDGQLLPPSMSHLMGTDELGRDAFSRLLAGGHLTLTVGVFSIAVALVAGVIFGAASGYARGRIETIVVVGVDVLLAFPAVLLAITIVATLGTGLADVILAIGIASIPVFTRVARASVLEVTARPFIRSAVALGETDATIIWRHVLPNIAGPLIVLTSIAIGDAILVGAAFSFLGLGAPPSTPEWGVMLSDAREFLRSAWWLTLFPGVAIALVVLGCNLLGDGVRDMTDPTLRVDRATVERP
jgi:peptide/nickel transport system permease protein